MDSLIYLFFCSVFLQWRHRDVHLLPLSVSLTHLSTFLDEGWRQQTTTMISFFSIVLDLVTSPLAECTRSQSTLQCRVSTVFSVCLDAVTLP